VRATSPRDVAILEPLPVDDEHGTGHAPAGVTFELAHDLADAGRATLERLHDAPSLTPWTHPDPRPRAAPRPNPSAFVRMVELDAARLAALPHWWQQHARQGRVSVTRRFSIEAPRHVDGTWTLTGRLRSVLAVRTIPFELTLWRQLDGWTKLDLQPQRRVIVAARYFREGHRALDLLVERLTHDFGARR
jgi:hypothetical protein